MGEYSVAIRTIGKAGEKYQKLLNSIKKSSVQPKKVVVVLPEGYDPPQERLGCEQFVYCEKSMIGQRIEALKYIDTEYSLFLDDDIEFDPDFVAKLLKPLEQGLFDCSTGPLFSFFPASKAGVIAGTLTASVSLSLFNRDKYVKILRSGGWSYHTFDTNEEHYYPTESFAWTCFMIRTEAFRNIQMEQEIPWVEKFGYAYGDDRVMAYKLLKRGHKACIVSNALYIHNDARTSTSANEMPNLKPIHCTGFFHIAFWYRFIKGLETNVFKQLWNYICLYYWFVSMFGYHLIKSIKKSHRPIFRAFFKGVFDGFQFVKSSEFKELPNVT